MQCNFCKKEFYPKRKWQKFCSIECQAAKNKPKSYGMDGLNTGTVGAMAELLAAHDLMKKGHEVYRALSPASSCDILSLKNGKSYKFEVRTGYYKNGNPAKIYYSTQHFKGEYFAVVTFADNKVHYIPDLR